MVLRGFLCRVQDSRLEYRRGTAEQPSSGFDRQLFSGTYSSLVLLYVVRRREQERQQQTRQTYREAVMERGRFNVTGAVYRTTRTPISYADMKRGPPPPPEA